MRLTRYINEARTKTEDIRSFYPQLYKDCKPYITDWKKARVGGFLYRGSHKHIREYDVLKSHIGGRTPKDTNIDLHDYLNNEFKNMFGWYVRDGVSTISDISLASTYGRGYIFFPVGNYNIVWSGEIGDLFQHLKNAGIEMPPDSEVAKIPYDIELDWEYEYGENTGGGHYEYELPDGKTVEGEDLDDIQGEINYYNSEEKPEGDPDEKVDRERLEWFPDTSLEDYVEMKQEDIRTRVTEEISDALDTYQEGNLKGAIHSENEVMVECDKYYLVDTVFGGALQKLIQRAGYVDPRQMELFDLEPYKI